MHCGRTYNRVTNFCWLIYCGPIAENTVIHRDSIKAEHRFFKEPIRIADNQCNEHPEKAIEVILPPRKKRFDFVSNENAGV